MIKKTPDDILNNITEVRANNNYLWMEIMRVALAADPEQTKALIKNIKENDSKISTLMTELTK